MYVRLAVTWTDAAGSPTRQERLSTSTRLHSPNLRTGGVVDEINEPEGTRTRRDWIGPAAAAGDGARIGPGRERASENEGVRWPGPAHPRQD